MLEFDTDRKKLSRVKSSTLHASQVLERQDLQAAFVSSWDAFKSELGFEELHYVGQEVSPHRSCDDRIDILAIDGDGRPVIMELKRGRDKLQLLQAITYAAMVSTWDTDRLIRNPGDHRGQGGSSGHQPKRVRPLMNSCCESM